jgi:alpha-tubulin suppressor-like RCC1 family protein
MSVSCQYAPGLLFLSAEGGTREIPELVGKLYCSVTGGASEVVAVCDDGTYAVDSVGSTACISTLKLSQVAVGDNFFIAVDASAGLYSWGTGCSGGQVFVLPPY